MFADDDCDEGFNESELTPDCWLTIAERNPRIFCDNPVLFKNWSSIMIETQIETVDNEVVLLNLRHYLNGVIGTVICVAGIICNILCAVVLWSLWRSCKRVSAARQQKTSYTYFLSLSVADSIALLLYCWLYLPDSLQDIWSANRGENATWEQTEFHQVWAYVQTPINGEALAFQCTSIWITVFFSLDRYLMICHPFHGRRWLSDRHTVAAIVTAFGIGQVYAILKILMMKLVILHLPTNVAANGTTDCFAYYLLVFTDIGQSPEYNYVVTTGLYFLLFSGFPLLVVGFTNYCILRCVLHSSRPTSTNGETSSRASRSSSKSKPDGSALRGSASVWPWWRGRGGTLQAASDSGSDKTTPNGDKRVSDDNALLVMALLDNGDLRRAERAPSSDTGHYTVNSVTELNLRCSMRRAQSSAISFAADCDGHPRAGRHSLGSDSVRKSRSDTALMLVGVVVMLIVCQLPTLFVCLASSIDRKLVYDHMVGSVFLEISNLLVIIMSASNVIPYYFFGSRFRQEFLRRYCGWHRRNTRFFVGLPNKRLSASATLVGH